MNRSLSKKIWNLIRGLLRGLHSIYTYFTGNNYLNYKALKPTNIIEKLFLEWMETEIYTLLYFFLINFYKNDPLNSFLIITRSMFVNIKKGWLSFIQWKTVLECSWVLFIVKRWWSGKYHYISRKLNILNSLVYEQYIEFKHHVTYTSFWEEMEEVYKSKQMIFYV